MANGKICWLMAHALTMLLPLCLSLGSHTEAKEGSDANAVGDRLFTLRVLPVFREKCFGCHGEDPNDVRGDYNLLTREAMLSGGESGEVAVVPGDPNASPLYQAVLWEGYEMPPKENDRLTEQQTEYLRRWIESGAPWPDAETQTAIQQREWSVLENEDGVIIPTSGGLADDWTYRRYKPEDIWAFRPVTKPAVPAGYENSVDAFVGSKLSAAKFSPAERADFRTLIRRATYDLTGLPPTPEEIEEFRLAWERDPSKAWGNLLDRLLASKHYGERWAQHWLDVARYADTAGLSNDYERSNAWRYRDYVIRAFNEDKPYDRFVVEQIAGDELADQSLKERVADDEAFELARKDGEYTPDESELLVASSFLRMGPWDPAMTKIPDARQQYLDDVVNSVGQTFLSTTMRCFKCHDHKFDPLPTRDYYRMYSVFATTQLAERPAPFLKEERLDGFQQSKAQVKRLFDYASTRFKQLTDKIEAAERKWYADRGLEYVEGDERKEVPDEEKPPRLAGLNEIEKGRHKVRRQDEWIWKRRLERYKPMVQSVYNGSLPEKLDARRLRMASEANQDWQPDSCILTGGSLEAPGEAVTPGVLSALNVATDVATEEDPYLLTQEFDGRRLGLAKWIANENNPITARSIVNRVWQHHFGKALAGNPNNFGAKGNKPTHPLLLDWLAVDFMEHGWKLKRLHRLIMTSTTYQQAGRHHKQEELQNQDPNNDLLAYFPNRRLTAEELRDSMLLVTGELNPQQGGLPIKPEMNMEVALQPRMIQFSLAPAYLPSRTPDQRNRRSIYAYRVRGLADPFLETFNQPNSNDSCEVRDAAAVSPQAFSLLNSDIVTDRSIAFALRLQGEAQDLGVQIQRGFDLAFGRHPDSAEQQRMMEYVQRMHMYHNEQEPPARTYPAKITRSLVEEFSGQPFEYEEILPVFEDYVPDKQAADVSPQTRALADFCLLLFNSNEFMYVY